MSTIPYPVPFAVMETVNGLLASVSSALEAAEQQALLHADAEGQRALQALDLERESAAQQYADLTRALDDTRDQLAAARAQANDLLAERDAMRAELDAMRCADAGVTESLTELRATLAQIIAERDMLLERVQAGHAASLEAAATGARLQAERTALAQALEMAQTELVGLRAERDTALDRAARAEGAADALRTIATQKREPIGGLRRRGSM